MRRRLLATSGAAAAFLAGCSGSSEEAPPQDDLDSDPDPGLRINDRYLSSAFPIEIVQPSFGDRVGFGGDARLVYVHWHGPEHSHWHQSPLKLATGESKAGRTRFLLDGAEEIPLGPAEPFTQRVVPTDETPDGLLTTIVDADRVEFVGDAPGTGDLVFELWSDDARQWTTPPLPVEIE